MLPLRLPKELKKEHVAGPILVTETDGAVAADMDAPRRGPTRRLVFGRRCCGGGKIFVVLDFFATGSPKGRCGPWCFHRVFSN
jgi:hypothetical protein